jgi:hypothetical protein
MLNSSFEEEVTHEMNGEEWAWDRPVDKGEKTTQADALMDYVWYPNDESNLKVSYNSFTRELRVW